MEGSLNLVELLLGVGVSFLLGLQPFIFSGHDKKKWDLYLFVFTELHSHLLFFTFYRHPHNVTFIPVGMLPNVQLALVEPSLWVSLGIG